MLLGWPDQEWLDPSQKSVAPRVRQQVVETNWIVNTLISPQPEPITLPSFYSLF